MFSRPEMQRNNVVFPAPVLPTMPTNSPNGILNERLSRTRSVVFSYLNEIFLTETSQI